MSAGSKSLYERLGGYDAITAVANNLLARLQADQALGRFWKNRGSDGIARETQLLIDYICSCAGGPMYYTGREMQLSHKGMGISEGDWQAFLGHLSSTLDAFHAPPQERAEVLGFIESIKGEIVEV